MRLTLEQIAAIVDTTHAVAGPSSDVWLFGSRLDDTRYGGDIDLLIESTPPIGLLQRARIKAMLEQKLQLPVDVVSAAPYGPFSPFVTIARGQAIRLESPPLMALPT
jgi:predicted nucleotidyltransferase